MSGTSSPPAKQRVQRLSDVIEVKGEGDDPWALAGEAVLTSVAAESAGDLAAFLSNTPEALAAAPNSAGRGAEAGAARSVPGPPRRPRPRARRFPMPPT